MVSKWCCVNTSHVIVHLDEFELDIVNKVGVNTSHVIVHPYHIYIHEREVRVSIHPMLLFIISYCHLTLKNLDGVNTSHVIVHQIPWM